MHIQLQKTSPLECELLFHSHVPVCLPLCIQGKRVCEEGLASCVYSSFFPSSTLSHFLWCEDARTRASMHAPVSNSMCASIFFLHHTQNRSSRMVCCADGGKTVMIKTAMVTFTEASICTLLQKHTMNKQPKKWRDKQRCYSLCGYND